MKKLVIIGILVVLACGCNGDNVPDCFQNAGELVEETVTLASFDKITVFENVQLVVKQGPVQEVKIETGEFLLEEVSAEVIGDRLVLRNTNNCNLFRDYGITKVVVTSPNITEIRSSTGWPVVSEGVLGFPELLLLTESFNNPESETTDGSFDMEVATQTLSIVANGIAYFQIRGTTENFTTTIAAGDSRVEAENLLAQNVTLNHRGSNDILVNPQQSLRGVIRGTGDVVSVNRPAIVDVEVLFKGQLIFTD
jgi:hypothetical protein